MIHGAPLLEAVEALALHNGTVLDVRTADEFRAGHIEGAVFMPLHIVPLRSGELDRAATYFIVCESGGRSGQACAYLAQQGLDVRSVEGGMAAWRAAGRPVATGL